MHRFQQSEISSSENKKTTAALTHRTMTAKDIEFNEVYEIARLEESDLTQKLAEMGCVPGTEIVKLYTAPGGDPIAFRIDAYILGLRQVEADQIVIRKPIAKIETV